ncbi:MAG: hypothetical protein LWX83_02065 [Anaerolineae bacterium]|nr:hypothetical protein [Anaerolineae bacterium]
MPTRLQLLTELDEAVNQLVVTAKNSQNPDRLIYEEWTVKDIVAHLTFWHESFARNVYDLACNQPPRPLKGRLRDLNTQGIVDKRDCSLDDVLQQLIKAHTILQKFMPTLTQELIPYRKGSRDYSPEEHLEIVTDHIRMHTKDISRI